MRNLTAIAIAAVFGSTAAYAQTPGMQVPGQAPGVVYCSGPNDIACLENNIRLTCGTTAASLAAGSVVASK
jgi:hypothetical protein